MRLLISSAAFGLALLGSHAFAQPAGIDPVGTWLTEDGRAKIRLEKCGADLCGFVVWLKDPLTDKGQPRTDIKKSDPAKRSRPSVGLELMENLTPDDSTHYSGEVYNADNGKKYSVTVGTDKPGELQVKGCMLQFLCGSQTCTRVADLPLPSSNKVVQNATKKPASGGQRQHDNQLSH